MFNLSTITHKKTLLLALLFPTIINGSMILSDETTVPTRLPGLSGTSIAVIGVGAAVGIKGMLESDNTNNFALGASLLGLAGGYAAYHYLSGFTAESKLEKANKILNKINNKIENNNLWKEITNSEISDETILNIIMQKHPEKHYSEIHFLNKNLKPLVKEIKKAEKLLETTIESLDEEYDNQSESKQTSILQKIVAHLKQITSIHKITFDDNLKETLTEKKQLAEKILKKIGNVSTAIKNNPNYKKDLEAFHKKIKIKGQTTLNYAQEKNITKQDSLLNTLLSNPVILQKLIPFIVAFYFYIKFKIAGNTTTFDEILSAVSQ